MDQILFGFFFTHDSWLSFYEALSHLVDRKKKKLFFSLLVQTLTFPALTPLFHPLLLLLLLLHEVLPDVALEEGNGRLHNSRRDLIVLGLLAKFNHSLHSPIPWRPIKEQHGLGFPPHVFWIQITVAKSAICLNRGRQGARRKRRCHTSCRRGQAKKIRRNRTAIFLPPSRRSDPNRWGFQNKQTPSF